MCEFRQIEDSNNMSEIVFFRERAELCANLPQTSFRVYEALLSFHTVSLQCKKIDLFFSCRKEHNVLWSDVGEGMMFI